ncbi:MAG: acyl-CoA dehydrogenase family protein [Acidimicrobiales bacterium]|nr:acyl-CoA dehydrogenase family protein [Acidimicrobiales bacterium]
MDFSLDPELHELAAEAREVGRKAAEGRWFHEDSWIAQTDREFSEELAARGWLGMTWPTEWGGGGRTPLERFVVFEELITEGAPIAGSWFADRQMGPTLLQYGTDSQRERFLPDIIAGTSMWCIGMSEPDAGSDVASLRTTAVRDGDDWIVDGQKIWNSGGALADWCYLVARTDPDAPKHKGLSEFIVDMNSPGITVEPIRDMTDDEHFCEIYFDDVRVPGDHLVGELNASFGQLMRQMEHERGGIDRLVSNKRLYLDCLDVLRADGRLGDPIIRDEIAAIETAYRIGRLLVLRETLQQAPKGFSAATKTFGTEFEIQVADFCGRVMGPGATLLDTGDEHRRLGARVARNICYAPGYTIMGGTTQILRNILGERVLGLPRA